MERRGFFGTVAAWLAAAFLPHSATPVQCTNIRTAEGKLLLPDGWGFDIPDGAVIEGIKVDIVGDQCRAVATYRI